MALSDALDKLLRLKNTERGVVLALEVNEEELVNRLLNRGLTSKRSDDTNEPVIRARITEYRNKTAVVAEYYTQFNKEGKVCGEGTVDEIFDCLCSEIDKRMS